MSRILRTESYQKGIVISTSFNFLSKGLLFFNSVLIAYYFGAQEKTDVYFFIFSSINFLIYFFYVLNTGVLIPESMRLREQENDEKAVAFLNRFFYFYLFLGSIILLLFFLEPIGIYRIFSKFSETTLQQNIGLIYLGTPLFILMLITNYFTEILASYRFFSMPMIAQFINNTFVLLFLLGLHSFLDIKSIFIGLLLAYSINIAMLFYLMKKRLKWKFFKTKIKIRKKVWYDILFVQAANFASLLGNFTPNYLFSAMPGILTSLSFGQKTANMPNDMITSQFNSVAGIRFNELFAIKDFAKVNVVFTETVKGLFYLLIPVAGFIFLFSDEIIQILYKRGAFSQEIADISSFYLKYLVILIPFFSFMGIINRLMISSQQIKMYSYVQIIINIVNIIMIFMGVRLYSYEGFAWAMIFSTIFQLVVTVTIIRLKFEFIKIQEIAKFVMILMAEIAIIIPINWAIDIYLLNSLSIFFRLAISFTLFFLLYFGINYIINLRFELIDQVYKKLKIKS